MLLPPFSTPPFPPPPSHHTPHITQDGWGYNKNYGSNFDKIFGSKTQAPKSEEADVEKKAAKAETQAASN